MGRESTQYTTLLWIVDATPCAMNYQQLPACCQYYHITITFLISDGFVKIFQMTTLCIKWHNAIYERASSGFQQHSKVHDWD